MIYRIEIHQTETKRWYSQVCDGDLIHAPALWESNLYDTLDDAYGFAKYEVEQRMEVDREARVLARLNESGSGLSEDQIADANGVPRGNR